jgi:hypothetical protein
MSRCREHAWNYLVLTFARSGWRRACGLFVALLLFVLVPRVARAADALDAAVAVAAPSSLALREGDTLWNLGEHAEYLLDESEAWTF